MSKKIIFVDQVAQYPNRFLVTDDGGGLKEVTPSFGTISITGTPISADNLNAVADEVVFKLKDTSSVANIYTASIDNLADYYDKLTVMFKPSTTNTDGSTLNLSTLGAMPIKKIDDAGTLVALSQNDLIKGKYYTMTYDNTDAQNPCFIMNNPSAELAGIVTSVNNFETRLNEQEDIINGLKTETIKFTVLQGTANTYAATISTVGALTSGLEINMVPNVTNTGASTLNINELGTKNITYNGSAITSGMLVQNKLYKVLYNGVSFELQPSSNFTPVSNGQVQTGLNADMVDGKNASDLINYDSSRPTNVDLNNYTNTGVWTIGAINANGPSDASSSFWGTIFVSTSSDVISQLLLGINSQVYYRSKTGGNGWTSWRQLASIDQLDSIKFQMSNGALQYSTDGGGTFNDMSAVKSIQRGVANGSGITMPINISAVNPSKCAVLLNPMDNSNTTAGDVGVYLESMSSTLLSVRVGNSTNFSWQVIEYN